MDLWHLTAVCASTRRFAHQALGELRELEVGDTASEEHGVDAAAAHILPALLQHCSALRRFQFNEAGSCFGVAGAKPTLAEVCVRRIAAHCPALQELDMSESVGAGMGLPAMVLAARELAPLAFPLRALYITSVRLAFQPSSAAKAEGGRDPDGVLVLQSVLHLGRPTVRRYWCAAWALH